MIKALIFEGGEGVSKDHNTIYMEDWTPEYIKAAFVEHLGDDWADEPTDMFEGGNILMHETIDIMNDRFAQAVTCPIDGGMTYIVRIS